MQTPVAFFAFRRPQTTRRVFEAIRAARPARLLIITDAPLRPDDADACAQVRAIVEAVDWECEVSRNDADRNMGLRLRLVSGLDWVFDQVESAIILEDDCLPDPSFFPFCEALLARYRDDPRVMHISGSQLHPARRSSSSYWVSIFPHIWGWATWRRAWRAYDPDLTDWRTNAGRRRFLARFAHADERRFWAFILDRAVSGRLKTWDYQWAYACIANEGLCLNPSVNLISNIGFGDGAVHTTDPGDPLAELATEPMTFPLEHPPQLAIDQALRRAAAVSFFSMPSLWQRGWRRALSMLHPARQTR